METLDSGNVGVTKEVGEMSTVDREVYYPTQIALESTIAAELPLLGGHAVTDLAEKLLDAVGSTGVLRDPGPCHVGFCGQDAVWNTSYCPEHTREP